MHDFLYWTDGWRTVFLMVSSHVFQASSPDVTWRSLSRMFAALELSLNIYFYWVIFSMRVLAQAAKKEKNVALIQAECVQNNGVKVNELWRSAWDSENFLPLCSNLFLLAFKPVWHYFVAVPNNSRHNAYLCHFIPKSNVQTDGRKHASLTTHSHTHSARISFDNLPIMFGRHAAIHLRYRGKRTALGGG